MKTFIKNELSGWKKIEVFWLLLACAVIAGLSIYWGDTLMGIISATTGVACVVCTGKGKLSAYIFGLVNCVLYAIISYKAKLYGETMLNALYYIPMQFVGFAVWKKNMNKETNEVKKRHMKNRGRIICLLAMVALTIAYGFLQLIVDPYIISIPQMLTDYIFAFGALGLSGLFSNKKHGLILGFIAGVLGRFVFTFLSGLIFFGSYASSYNMTAPVYSFVYNGSYIGAETVITVIILMLPPVAKGLARVKIMAQD